MRSKRIKHKIAECGCELNECYLCRNAILKCIICGAEEGELLHSCPGFKLNDEAKNACLNGNVVDFFNYYLRSLAKTKKKIQ